MPSPWVFQVTDFANGNSDGWLPGFADYSLPTASTNRLAEVRRLPKEVAIEGWGYYLRGRNTSDDLFMFLKRPVTDLAAGRSYRVAFYMEVASAAPSNCVGIGGPPGESVWLKSGATTQEPVALLQGDDIGLNVDKGNQSNGGKDAVIVSTIANGVPCESASGKFVLLRQTAILPDPVKADLSGTAWTFVGTDSGFEGTTELYYGMIVTLFTLQP